MGAIPAQVFPQTMSPQTTRPSARRSRTSRRPHSETNPSFAPIPPMRLIYNILFAVTLVGGSIAAWLIPSTTTASPVVDATPASIRQTAIAFYEHRLTEDPHSALDMAQLAALVMEEGRMSGDERSFVKAESLAIRSLGERT